MHGQRDIRWPQARKNQESRGLAFSVVLLRFAVRHGTRWAGRRRAPEVRALYRRLRRWMPEAMRERVGLYPLRSSGESAGAYVAG